MDDTMIVSTLRSHIESLLRATKRDGVEDLLRYMNRRGFFTKPCGEHHPMVGGLAWHSLEVLFGVIKENEYDIPLSSIVIVSLLHEANLLAKDAPKDMEGTTAVTIITKNAHFELLPAEKEAILFQKYSTSDLVRIFNRPSCTIGNPLRSLLRFANDSSEAYPKSWEELTDLMNGKYQFPQKQEKDWRSHNFTHVMYQSESTQEILSFEEAYARFMRLKQKPKPSSIDQIEDALEQLEEYGIDMHTLYEFLYDKFEKHHFGYYKDGVSETLKEEMDDILQNLCRNDRSVDKIVDFIYGDHNKHIFDTGDRISHVYKELVTYFGFKLKLNTLQLAVNRYYKEKKKEKERIKEKERNGTMFARTGTLNI